MFKIGDGRRWMRVQECAWEMCRKDGVNGREEGIYSRRIISFGYSDQKEFPKVVENLP